MPSTYCPTCAVVAAAKRLRSSFVIELVVWACLLVPRVIYSVWQLGALVYSVWRIATLLDGDGARGDQSLSRPTATSPAVRRWRA